MQWMIYGANGYTGKLLVEEAHKRGHQPVLAGRNAEALEALGAQWNLPVRVVRLDDGAALRAALQDVGIVLHAAGPFSHTAEPMLDACVATGTHYLDITGELAVFESLFRRSAEAEQAGITVLPGAGFDVVPTDNLAGMLAWFMPDATHLELGFHGLGQPSAGTTRSSVERLGHGGAARVDGEVVDVPHGWRSRELAFEDGSVTGVTIPWGDICTAWHTTGIPNIVVYMAMPERMRKALPWVERMRPVLKQEAVVRGLKWWVGKTVKGPSSSVREAGGTRVWGEVRNASGEVLTGSLRVADGYTFTAQAGVRIVERLQHGEVRRGTVTPTMAFGREFVLELPDVSLAPFRLQGQVVTHEELEASREERSRIGNGLGHAVVEEGR